MRHTYEYKRWIESDSDYERERFLKNLEIYGKPPHERHQWLVKIDTFCGPSGARYMIVEMEDGRCRHCEQVKPIEVIWETCKECLARPQSCIKDEYWNQEAVYQLRTKPKETTNAPRT